MVDLTGPKHTHTLERLRDDVILWLASMRPDGRPHIVPVWFLWENGTVLIFSKPDNQKVRNLRQHPQVVLALDDTQDGEDVVMLDGTAELVDDASVTAALPAYAAKYHTRIQRLFGTPEQMAALYSQAIRVTPTKVKVY
ncbi:MAG TPA: TIGR03667 family PPOX class F420-dependent oxidoreductase [Ktedonobacterales bacterium]